MSINVLSLCDGIACARIALEKSNIKVDNYFAAEIKSTAIKCAITNYPDIIEIGDVKNISYQDRILKTEKGNFEVDHFDLVCFGFPCQTLSIITRSKDRIGLENLEKSGLFYECYRILQEVNPKYFFIENVASMKQEYKELLNEIIGCEPIKIDSQIVAPAMRKRLYWTNLKCPSFDPKDSINLNSIIEFGYTERKKARALLAGHGGLAGYSPLLRFRRYYKQSIGTLIFEDEKNYNKCVELIQPYLNLTSRDFREATKNDTIFLEEVSKARVLTQHEMEACMTIPLGYTDCLSRNQAYEVLGNGWTVDVICHFFKNIE